MKHIIFIGILVLFTALQVCGQEQDEKLAVQYYSDGEFEKAATIFEKLYKKKPSTYYYNYLLNSYIEGKNYDDAIGFIKKAMRQNNNDIKMSVDLGYVNKLSGNTEKAKKEFEAAINNITDNKSMIINLANAFLIRNETEYAINTLLQGKKKLTENYNFGFELAPIYEHQSRFDDMVSCYLDLLEISTTLYLTEVQNKLQTILSKDPEGLKSQALTKELLKRIQANPNQSFYSEMLLWFALQNRDFEMALLQAKALDKRFKQNGMEVYKVGEVALSNEDYKTAGSAFDYIIQKGEDNYYFIDSKLNKLRASYLQLTRSPVTKKEEFEKLEAAYKLFFDEYGKNKTTLPLIKDLALILAFYNNKSDIAIELLKETLETPGLHAGIAAECKILLADILLSKGDVWEATLLYSQVEKAFKNDPLAHEAKFKNAKLSYYISEFDWAKAQLDVLKASTSKLIANDALELSLLISDNIDADSSYIPLSMFARADLKAFQNKLEDAWAILDSIETEFEGHVIIDDVIYKKAIIALKRNDFQLADSLLNKIVTAFSQSILADDALLKRAVLYETVLNKPDKAMQLYQDLLINYPSSLFTVEARKKYRILRGDKIN